MKDKEIILLKEKYEETLERNENNRKIFERIEKLEENEFVREYISLLKNIDVYFKTPDIETIKRIKLAPFDDRNILLSAFTSMGPVTDTNDIWIYGKTKIKYNDVFRTKTSYDSSYYDSKYAVASIYQNLETNKRKTVSVSSREDFEKSHNVLIDKDYVIYDSFNDIQYLYLKNLLEYGNDYTYSDLEKDIRIDENINHIRIRK